MKTWIVSNRLPVTFNKKLQKFVPSSGGLVSAFKGASISNFNWMGYAGDTLSPIENDATVALHSVDISSETYSKYYNGFSNNVLWPLFHYETGLMRYEREEWDAYEAVNKTFAESIVQKVGEDDCVWIQDYQLARVPFFLRKMGFKGRIGFFLHIPFPSSEVFRQLPARKEILEGLLSADLIGFHDVAYQAHFLTTCRLLIGSSVIEQKIQFNGYSVSTVVAPIGIDTDHFFELSESQEVKDRVIKIRNQWGNTRVFLGVDRLDYSKGLELKVLAFREMLEKNPDLCGHVQLVQVAVPSRENVKDYRVLKKLVENLVARVNSDFGTLEWTPIKFLFRSISEQELVSLYRSADALLVTSKRDGMNLVSFEFVASRKDLNNAPVVISEMTGAAGVLSGAFTVNPWDIARTAEVMHRVLNSSSQLLNQKMLADLHFVETNTASQWASQFLNRLKSLKREQILEPMKIDFPASNQTKIEASHIMVDYDGTLVPFHADPLKALPTHEVTELLTQLSQQYSGNVCVVSGRPLTFLKEVFRNVPVHLAANHGATFFDHQYKTLLDLGPQSIPWLSDVREMMHSLCKAAPGSFVEEKPYGLAWHYRECWDVIPEIHLLRMTHFIQEKWPNADIDLLAGHKVIEVRSKVCDKGKFVERYIQNRRIDGMIVAIGDDVTDEQMFKSLRMRDASVRVGTDKTAAKYWLQNQNEVIPFLRTFSNRQLN